MKSDVRVEAIREGIKSLNVDAGGFPLHGRRIFVFGLGLWATDIIFLSSLLFFSVITILFNAQIPGTWTQVLKNMIVGLVYLGTIHLHQQTSSRALRFWIRMTSAQLMFAYVFPLITPLQLIISKNWNDPVILNLEQAVFGVQPTIWIQKFISPALTEWMMFSYVMYLPLYPILCGILYFKHSELHMEDFVFKLAFANLLCDLGFILYPVAGPFYKIANRFTVPLKGYFFTFVGEYIRIHFQGIGASIPSPHCAISTIMWITAYRYHRPTFYMISPIILSIYVSAFYSRYHYLSDVLFGILAGVATLIVVPFLMKSWNIRADRRVS
jgi:hypothetical protein